MNGGREISVLITGACGASIAGQCIQALQLANTRYKIIATNTNPASLWLFNVHKSYLVPSAYDAEYVDTLLRICKKEKIEVIIPGSDPELMNLSDTREQFEDEGIIVLANHIDVINTCQDKWKTYKLLKSKGFKVPKSYMPEDENYIDYDYPVVIKPYRGGGGSKNLFLAQDDKELSFFINYLKKQGASPMVQEYIGSADEEYTVGVLSTMEGDLLGSIAMKRRVKESLSTHQVIREYNGQRTFIISSGISQGRIDEYKKVRENAEKIATTIGSQGPLNVQCRLTDDGVYAFEINPRFSGTTSIRALCGFNEPDTLIRKHLLGENTKKMRYKKGIVLRGLQNHYISLEDYGFLVENGFYGRNKHSRKNED